MKLAQEYRGNEESTWCFFSCPSNTTKMITNITIVEYCKYLTRTSRSNTGTARLNAQFGEEMASSRRRFRRDLNSKNEILEGTEKEVSRLKNELKETNEKIEGLQVEAQSRRRKLDAMKRELKRVSSWTPVNKTNTTVTHDDDADVERARRRLESFYTSKDPENKNNIGALLRKFESSSRVDMLMQVVESKYMPSSSSTVSSPVIKNRSTPSRAHRENDELVVWGLKQQLTDNEKLFSDELHAISLQQSNLRDRYQNMLREKNQQVVNLQKSLTAAREEHAEAMKKSKLDREMDMTRLKLELQDEMREQTKVSENNHEEQKERITKRRTPPPSPPRTPDPILFVEKALNSERSGRSARAKERAARRRLMRDKERTSCREAAGDGAIDEGDE